MSKKKTMNRWRIEAHGESLMTRSTRLFTPDGHEVHGVISISYNQPERTLTFEVEAPDGLEMVDKTFTKPKKNKGKTGRKGLEVTN